MENNQILEYKVNQFITLKLEGQKTFIYVNDVKFIQCFKLILSIAKNELRYYENIDSIDEALQKNKLWNISSSATLDQDQEFWAHCSNIQVWAEHRYDTRLLHSNLSFPLLERLNEAGDLVARKVFKEEIVKRLESKTPTVIRYLVEMNYLDFFSEEEFKYIIESNKDIIVYLTLFEETNKLEKYLSKSQINEIFNSAILDVLENELKILNDVIDNYDLESKAANTIFQHKEKIINDFLDNLIYKKVDNRNLIILKIIYALYWIEIEFKKGNDLRNTFFDRLDEKILGEFADFLADRIILYISNVNVTDIVNFEFPLFHAIEILYESNPSIWNIFQYKIDVLSNEVAISIIICLIYHGVLNSFREEDRISILRNFDEGEMSIMFLEMDNRAEEDYQCEVGLDFFTKAGKKGFRILLKLLSSSQIGESITRRVYKLIDIKNFKTELISYVIQHEFSDLEGFFWWRTLEVLNTSILIELYHNHSANFKEKLKFGLYNEEPLRYSTINLLKKMGDIGVEVLLEFVGPYHFATHWAQIIKIIENAKKLKDLVKKIILKGNFPLNDNLYFLFELLFKKVNQNELKDFLMSTELKPVFNNLFQVYLEKHFTNEVLSILCKIFIIIDEKYFYKIFLTLPEKIKNNLADILKSQWMLNDLLQGFTLAEIKKAKRILNKNFAIKLG